MVNCFKSFPKKLDEHYWICIYPGFFFKERYCELKTMYRIQLQLHLSPTYPNLCSKDPLIFLDWYSILIVFIFCLFAEGIIKIV